MTEVAIQIASVSPDIPEPPLLTQWTTIALEQQQDAELSIRIVDEDESRTLNRHYRQQDKPTNVLSFPADIPTYVNSRLLGDLVICAPIVVQEAQAQQKPAAAHWAHMVIHGTLHLRGYDHIEPEAAEIMETLEIRLLAALGFASPYNGPVGQ